MWRYRLCAACSLVVFLFVDVAFSITNTESSKPAAVPAAVPASASAPAANHDTEAAEYTEVSQFQPLAQQLTRGAGGGTLSPLQQTQILSDVQQHRFQLQQTQPQAQPQQRTINFQSPAQVPFNRPLYPTQPQFTQPTIGAVAQNYLNNPQLVAQIRHQLQIQQQQQQRPLPQYPTPQLPSPAQQHVRTNYQPQQLPPVYRSQVPTTYQQQPLPPSKINFQQPQLQQQPSRPPIGSTIVATQPTQTAQNPIPERFNPTVPLTQQTFLPTVAHPAPTSTQYTIETPQQTTYARPQQTVVQPSPEYNIELAPKRKPVKSTTTTTTTETPATTTKHIPYRLRYRTTTESPEIKTTTQRDSEFYVKQDNQKLLQQLIEAQQQQIAVTRPEKSTTANQVPQIEIQDELQKHIQQQLQSDGIFQQFKGAVPASPDQLAALPNLDFLAGNDSTPSVVLPNGQKVKIIQVPSSLVSGGSKAAKSSPQIKTIYLNQPTSPPAPTTTVRPPKLVFEELSKDFLPPGADFQVIRQRQDGDLEDIGSTIPQNLPQKKVTFVILEEQPDGTVKVQGVRGNANTEEVSQPLEVDSIIKKLEGGEIKLPPSTKLAPSQRTRSPVIPTNVTPQESVESPAYIKHTGKVPGKHSVFEPTPVSRVPPNYAVESSTKYNQPLYSPSYDAEPTRKYSQPSYTQNYNVESTTKYSQPSYTQNYNVETTVKYSQPTSNHRYNVDTSTKYTQPFNRQSYNSETSPNNRYSRPAQSNVYKTETTTVKHNRQVYNVESSTPFSHTVTTPDSESTTTTRYSLPPFTLRAKETYYPTTPAPKLQQYVPIVRNSPTKISYTSANVANSHAGPTFPLNDFTSAGKQRDSSDLYSSKIHTNDNHLNVLSPNAIQSSERPAEEVIPSLVPTATVQYNVEDPSVSTNTLLPFHGISSTAAPPPFITSSTTPNYVTETSSTAFVQPSVGSSYQPEYSSQNQNTYQQPNHVYDQHSQFQQFTTTESAPLDIGIRTTPSPVDVNPLSLNSVLRREGLYAMAKFLRQSGLDSILNTTGPYTLFVPTDRAFRALLVQLGGPDKAEEKFQENPRLLSGLLLHHVIPGAFQAEALQDEMTGVSLAGTQLRVNTYTTQDEEWNDVKVLTINGAQVLSDKKDIVVPQGIAHAIDRVMFPLPVGDILQTLQSDREGKFNRFLKVVQDSGVASMITGGRTYTIFAPMNHAFKAADVKRFEENRALARNFVLRHLMPGTLYSDGMLYYQLKESLDKNKQLAILKEAGRIKVNAANVIARNIPATNGVVHAIDNLL